MTTEAVAVEEEAIRVAALPLGSLGDSGVVFLQMFDYVGSPGYAASFDVECGRLIGEAMRLRNYLADSKEKASNMEDTLQHE
ncbi:hypothetical protein GUJ93_ZPchr0010g8458 [Zizania palustris]|uniref:Uncharacterized protein n=1 Tax=Zizania palustris TaxID=103762 RepID=A0A8J5VVU8_ZIZPA|nr:hypothetical protein GUJ93_ZPchr0010g8458 [Zizania palustris]